MESKINEKDQGQLAYNYTIIFLFVYYDAGIQKQHQFLKRAFNQKLVELLPMEDAGFRAVLFQENLLSDDLAEQIRNAKDRRRENNELFLSTVIYRALSIGNVDPFKFLLRVMENFNDEILERLAQDISSELSKIITMTSLPLEDEG